MMVFVSDLHIGDRSTGVQHLEAAAFLEALPNIARQADGNGATEVIFVFLGDVFDMIRSDFWKDSQTQPWQWPQPGPKFEDDLIALMGRIETSYQGVDEKGAFIKPNNLDIFDLWGHELVGRHFEWKTGKLLPRLATRAERDAQGTDPNNRAVWPCEVEPRRLYIPGNHDRPINQFDSLRELAIRLLGLNIRDATDQTPLLDSGEPFPYFILNPAYGVFARHGQEWDGANFEHVERFEDFDYEPSREDYLDVPLGDLIAIEYSLLPGRVLARMQGTNIPKADRVTIADQLKVIDDVRPQFAVLPWIFDSIKTNPAMARNRDALVKVLFDELAASGSRLNGMSFVQHWMQRHQKWGRFDETEIAGLTLKFLEELHNISRGADFLHLNLYNILSGVAQKLTTSIETIGKGNYEIESQTDLGRIKGRQSTWGTPEQRIAWAGVKETLYILYGHTHRAEQVPLTVPDLSDEAKATAPDVLDLQCAVYLNTGTWRPLQRQTVDQKGFMRWKNLTFTMFYSARKDPQSQAAKSKLQEPTFETWTGSLLSPPTAPQP